MFHWSDSVIKKLGRSPEQVIEVAGEAEDDNFVMTGIGIRVADDKCTTLHLQFAPIGKDGIVGERKFYKYGTQPEHSLEAFVEVDPQEVIVGLGMRVGDDKLTTLKVYSRPLDPATGRLGELKSYFAGSNPKHALEVDWYPTTKIETTLLTGVKLRIGDDTVTTLHLKASQIDLNSFPSLYNISRVREEKDGSQPEAKPRVFYQTESDHLVMVGMGFRLSNGQLTTMELKLAPILANGTVSADWIRLSFGSLPEAVLDTWYECSPGQLIVGCGMGIGDDKMMTLQVYTRHLDPITGRLVSPEVIRLGAPSSLELDVDIKPRENPESQVLIGIGVSIDKNHITTLSAIYGTIGRRIKSYKTLITGGVWGLLVISLLVFFLIFMIEASQ